MFKQILDVWKNNHGTMLAIAGVAVAAVMSVAWRLDLLPDIAPSIRSAPSVLGGRSKPLPNIVVCSIAYDEARDAEVTLQIYSPPESSVETLTPILTRNVKLHDGLSEFVLTELARGVFAGMAYIDTNENSLLDLAPDGTPAEPFGFVKAKANDDAKRPAQGVFEILGEPLFLKIQLRKPTSTAASSAIKTKDGK